MKAYVVFNTWEGHLIHTKMIVILCDKLLATVMMIIHCATAVRSIDG